MIVLNDLLYLVLLLVLFYIIFKYINLEYLDS